MGAGGGIAVGLCLAAITLSAALHGLYVVCAVLIGIGLLIFVHELGHFLVAKACGVKCEKFYLGFDVPIKIGPIALPRTLGRLKLGETEYGIGIIPLGGYVKMLGQDDNPANARKEAARIRIAKGATAEAASPSGQDGASDDALSDEQYELDPRSYPAKSVPQRMAIISAGVIMNLISAVAFAAIAYRMGVSYEPCEIGTVAGGSPAWVHNVPIGARVVQIGRSGTENDYLRFDWDLVQQIILHSAGEEPTPLDLQLELPDGQRQWISITPSDRLVKRALAESATLGVRQVRSTTLSSNVPIVPGTAAASAQPPLQAGDRVIAVNGRALDASRVNERGEFPSDELDAAEAAQLSKPLTLTVVRDVPGDRGAPGRSETLEVTLPPQPLRTVGLIMRMGPVESVREGSPAERAGLQAGDLILRVNGQAVGDPMVLPQQFEQWISQEVHLDVARPTAEALTTIELSVTPEPRYRYDELTVHSALVPIESIGVAYSVGTQVVGVEPGSPAEKAGLRAGDLLQRVLFAGSADGDSEVAAVIDRRAADSGIELTAQREDWPLVFTLLQKVPADVELKIGFLRAGQAMDATLRPAISPNWFYVDRGLPLAALGRVHTAGSWLEAWQLGLRETKESLQKVVRFVVKLATARVPLRSLGGPLTIVAVAGSEASADTSRLLLFMTFLSANLAILNFLPIPALDGGHMLFLLAEAVTGKPVDERLQGALTFAGVVCLLALMVLVFYNDIGRLVRIFGG